MIFFFVLYFDYDSYYYTLLLHNETEMIISCWSESSDVKLFH